MDGQKKIGTSEKGDRGGPFYEVISQKIFNLSDDGFPNQSRQETSGMQWCVVCYDYWYILMHSEQ